MVLFTLTKLFSYVIIGHMDDAIIIINLYRYRNMKIIIKSKPIEFSELSNEGPRESIHMEKPTLSS